MDGSYLQPLDRDRTAEVRGLDLLELDAVDALQPDRAELVRGAVGRCSEYERAGQTGPSRTGAGRLIPAPSRLAARSQEQQARDRSRPEGVLAGLPHGFPPICRGGPSPSTSTEKPIRVPERAGARSARPGPSKPCGPGLSASPCAP